MCVCYQSNKSIDKASRRCVLLVFNRLRTQDWMYKQNLEGKRIAVKGNQVRYNLKQNSELDVYFHKKIGQFMSQERELIFRDNCLKRRAIPGTPGQVATLKLTC